MHAILDTLLTWSASLSGAEWLAELAAKGAIWLAAAGVTALALRRAGAAARHLVWAFGLGGLLVLPVAGSLLPPLRGAWTSPAPARAPEVRDVAAASPVSPAVRLLEDPGEPLPAAPLVANPRDGSAPHDWPARAALVWVLGVGIGVGWLAVSLGRVHRLRRRVRVETDARWLELVQAIAAEAGVRRPVTLVRSLGPAMPMTWGVWRPTLLLPPEADHWPAARCRDVLRHELAHVRRGDWVTQLIASVACAVHWFNPLVWLAARALCAERERACDDLVLRAGTRASDYAGHLLDIARGFRTEMALAGMALARPRRLEQRLRNLLDVSRPRSGLTPAQRAAAACGALALALPLAAAAPRAPLPDLTRGEQAAVSASSARAAIGSTSEPAHTTEPAIERSLVADTLPECVGREPPDGEHHGVHVNDGIAVHTAVGRCWLRFVAEGEVEFTDDFTDVARIASTGLVSLETDNGEVRRRLEIRPGQGTLDRRYTVNGAEHPYDDEARRWCAGALTLMFRSSGVAAEQRAAWILMRQGPAGLLAELAELRGDYARRRYAQYALAHGALDATAQARLLTWAGQNIGSDYDLAQVLITSAREPLAPPVQAAFVAAARTLESDYERRRVLSTALSRADLDASGAAAVLEAALAIESDYDLALLLVQWQRGRTLDEGLRPAFFRATASLQSDYERRRVLSAVVARGTAAPDVVAAALGSAEGIESDYDLAEVLTAVAELYALSEPLRPAFFAAVSALESDYERGRTLKTLATRDDLGPAALGDLLAAAAAMSPGYERAEVLVTVARRYRLTGTARDAFMKAAEGLGEYDYNRVMGALGRGRGSI